VIAYASNRLTKAERNYCITRKELLAVYKYVRQFSHYLYGQKFIVRTDHQALIWMLNWKKPSTSQYCSWIAELEIYEMDVQHRPGKLHANADALSRLPQCQQCELKHDDPKEKRQVKILNDSSSEQTKELPANILRHLSRPHWDQEGDADLKAVLQALRRGRSSKMPVELNSSSRTAKLLWKRRDDLRIRGDQLHILQKDPTKYSLIVPKQERKRLIHDVHKGSGHIGISKTAALIRKSYYWPEMDDDIRLTINSCSACLMRKGCGARITPKTQTVLTGYPFEKIAIDITGPLVPCSSGERFILGIIDYFSKYPMLIPLRSIDAKCVADVLFKHWICIFGAPDTIHSDRGTVFESSLFHELCELCGIRKTKSAPYYPQSDGLIERLFGTAKDMMFATTQAYPRDWKKALPIISMGIRSTVQRATGVSPFEVIFGRSMKTPWQWSLPVPYSKTEKPIENKNLSDYTLELRERLRNIHDEIRNRYSVKGSTEESVTLLLGQRVMAKIFPVVKGIDCARYYGPFKVVGKLGPWTFRLQHCETGEVIERNIHHLKKIAGYVPAEKKQSKETNICSQKSLSTVQSHPVEVTKQRSGASEHRRKRNIRPPSRYGFHAGQ
jgi:hypothetical protein